MSKIFWLALLAVTLSGCGELRKQFGRQKGQTLVTFNVAHNGGHDPLSVVYPLYGGMLVIIKSDTTNDFGTTVFVPNDATSVQVAVPNGAYHAGAIGWEGNDTAGCTPGTNCFRAQGQSKCGIAYNDTVFSLTGQSVTIPIVMNASVCQTGYSGNSTPFSDVTYNPTGDSAFPKLNFQTSNATYISGTHYLGIWLNTYDMAQGVKTRKGHYLLSCVSMTSGSASSAVRLPVGKSNGDDLFSYTLTFHGSVDSTCATVNDTAEFDKGFITNPTSGNFTTSTITYSGSNINTIAVN